MTNETPSNTIYPEIGFSCEPVSDDAITYFCYNYLDYAGLGDDYERDEMIKALKEVCRTPTGRQAFRATQNFINEKRKTDPDYKIEVDFAGHSIDAQGAVSKKEPNKIYLLDDNIKISVDSAVLVQEMEARKKGEPIPYTKTSPESVALKNRLFYFHLGTVFLHEAGHVRQLNNPDELKDNMSKLHADAMTQAISRQIILESELTPLHIYHNIPEREITLYHKAVDYDPKTGSFDTKKATVYSAQMLQKRTKDFITNLEDKPYINHTDLKMRWAYLQQDILYTNLLRSHTNTEEFSSLNDPFLKSIQQTHQLNMDETINRDHSGGFFFEEKGKLIREKLSDKEKNSLLECCLNKVEPKKSLFKSDDKYTAEEKYKLATEFYTGLEDVNKKLAQLSKLSKRIYDNPNDKVALRKSAKIRQELAKYGIKISTQNKYGRRIAQTEAEPTPTSSLSRTLAMSGNDITQGSAKTDSTQRSIAPQQNTRLT